MSPRVCLRRVVAGCDARVGSLDKGGRNLFHQPHVFWILVPRRQWRRRVSGDESLSTSQLHQASTQPKAPNNNTYVELFDTPLRDERLKSRARIERWPKSTTMKLLDGADAGRAQKTLSH